MAFKEWAVICHALAVGRQALILRKGGIEEAGGEFRPEQDRFWLYPTWTHQKLGGLRRDAEALLETVEKESPPAGVLCLRHFVEVSGVYTVRDLASALVLSDLHLWSQDMIEARFAYRWPGLYVLPVRVFRAAEAHELEELPAYAGCRTWVELERELPTAGASPVLDADAFRSVMRTLDDRLRPTAWA